MEELEPQDIEDLLQELEEEDGTQESPQQEFEEHLNTLQSGSDHLARQAAAEQLSKVATSSPRTVRALIAAYESDPFSMVNRAAAKSLRAPVHQEYLQRHPDLMETAERSLQQGPGADRQLPGLDVSSVRAGGEAMHSFLSDAFHDRRWRWAPIYATFLLVATSLVFVVSSLWTLLAAGVVWLAGGVLGLVILKQKGYPAFGIASGFFDLVDDNRSGSCLLVFLALLALVGPVILLLALLMRPEGCTVGVSKRRAKAKDAGRTKPALITESGRPSDCSACGAWNATGSEYCGECGAVLAGAPV